MGFRRDIARGSAGPTRGDDQLRPLAQADQRRLDNGLLIGSDLLMRHLESALAK